MRHSICEQGSNETYWMVTAPTCLPFKGYKNKGLNFKDVECWSPIHIVTMEPEVSVCTCADRGDDVLILSGTMNY